MNSIWNNLRTLYRRYREQINYLIVGGLTTVVSLVTYWFCVSILLNAEDPLQLQVANVISWICAVTFAYFTNRRFVFFSQEQNRIREAGKFFLSRLTTLAMEMAIMALGVSVLRINDKVVKLVAQIIIIIANYVLSKLLVFRRESTESGRADG